MLLATRFVLPSWPIFFKTLRIMTTTSLLLKNSRNRSSCPFALLLIPLAVACFGLSPQARAVCQDGCLTNSNTVLGDDALISDTTGSRNTATGFQALLNNTTGLENTAIGHAALYYNTTGSVNTAVGANALQDNTTGTGNTVIGDSALLSNTTCTNNTAIGIGTLSISNGNNNTAVGFDALVNNTTGNSNIAVGPLAGFNLTTGDNNIEIGNPGVAGEFNAIRIGKKGTHEATFIAGISGVTVAGGVPVIVNANGRLGTSVSSERYKDAITPLDKASESIFLLRPVSFRYKRELDPEGIPQFGLVAEEVEKINPDLVARDEQGKPYSVRYEAVNAMLLNEFLKEHRKVTEQGSEIAELKGTIVELTSAVKEQAAAIRKVNEEIKASQCNPRLVSAIPQERYGCRPR